MFDPDRVARLLARWPDRTVLRELNSMYDGQEMIFMAYTQLENTLDVLRHRLKLELDEPRQTPTEAFFDTAGSYGLDMVHYVIMFLKSTKAAGSKRPVVKLGPSTIARHYRLLQTWDAALMLFLSVHECGLGAYKTPELSRNFSERMSRVEEGLHRHYVSYENNWTTIKKFFEHVKGWQQLSIQVQTGDKPSGTRYLLPPSVYPSRSSVVDRFDALSVTSRSGGGAVNNDDNTVSGNARDEDNGNDEKDENEDDTMDLELANIFMTNGRNACREQDYLAAEENFLETLQLIDEGISTDHPKFGYNKWSVLTWLWTSQVGSGNNDAVIASTRSILEDQGPEQSHAHNDLDTASVASFYPDSVIDDTVRSSARYWLAVAYCRKGALPEAEQNALMVLREVRRRFSRGKPDVVNTIDLLVNVYTAMKKPVKAEAYRQLLPLDHPKRVKADQDNRNERDGEGPSRLAAA